MEFAWNISGIFGVYLKSEILFKTNLYSKYSLHPVDF